MLIFHDLEECCIGDFHKVANRYINFNRENIVFDQIEKLDDFSGEILNYWNQIEKD